MTGDATDAGATGATGATGADANATGATVEIVRDDGTPVFHVSGELDISSSDSVRPLVEEVLKQRPEQVVFDLSGLQFMDSSGIAVLLTVARSVPTVELRNVPPIMRRVIEMTGLAATFVIT